MVQWPSWFAHTEQIRVILSVLKEQFFSFESTFFSLSRASSLVLAVLNNAAHVRPWMHESSGIEGR